MTHGLFWIPGHDMTASLQLFAQQGFKGWHEWNPKKKYFFPDLHEGDGDIRGMIISLPESEDDEVRKDQCAHGE